MSLFSLIWYIYQSILHYKKIKRSEKCKKKKKLLWLSQESISHDEDNMQKYDEQSISPSLMHDGLLHDSVRPQ